MAIETPYYAFNIEGRGRLSVLETKGIILNPENKKNLQGQFIWDTGATKSVINQNLTQNLRLTTTGFSKVYTANGLATQPRKKVDIILPFKEHKIVFPQREVSSANLTENILALIGMDIISLGSLLITHNLKDNKNSFQFSIPSLKQMDQTNLLQLSHKENRKNLQKLKRKNPNHPSIKHYPTGPKIKI